MASSSSTTIAVNVFASPAEAFRALKESPKFWLPLILLIVATAAATAYFFNGIDLQAFFEQIFAAQGQMTEAQVAQASETLGNLPQVGVAVALAVFAPIAIVVTLLLYAFYLKIVTWITKDEILYKQWFALVCWANLPALLAQIAAIVNMATNDFRLMPLTRINPLTFPNLLGIDSLGDARLDTLATTYDPTHIWVLLLLIVGYKIFSGRGIGLAVLVVLIPTALRVAVMFLR